MVHLLFIARNCERPRNRSGTALRGPAHQLAVHIRKIIGASVSEPPLDLVDSTDTLSR